MMSDIHNVKGLYKVRGTKKLDDGLPPKLWGEIPPTPIDKLSTTSQFTDVMQKELNVLGAKFYHHDSSAKETKEVTDAIPCQRTLHTIKLVEYFQKHYSLMSEIREIIDVHRQAEEAEKNSNVDQSKEQSSKSQKEKSPCKKSYFKDLPTIPKSFPEALPIPPTPESISLTQKDFSTEYIKDSPFVEGIGESPPQISSSDTWEILRKSTATILAHAGFATTSDEVLDLLTDITENYFGQLCQTFRRHAARRDANSPLFPDVLQKTFKDGGVKNLASLGEFYERRIVQYHTEMVEACIDVQKDYEKLRQSPELREILKNAKNLKDTNRSEKKRTIDEESLDDIEPSHKRMKTKKT